MLLQLRALPRAVPVRTLPPRTCLTGKWKAPIQRHR